MSDLLEILAELGARTVRGPWPHVIDGVPAHGIVSMDPPTVRCDGCGGLSTHPTSIRLAVILGGVLFSARRAASIATPDRRRLCRGCAWDAWPETRVSDYGWAVPRPDPLAGGGA